MKPTVAYQKEDLRISGTRIGIVDANNRGKHEHPLYSSAVKEEFDCNEMLTPDMGMPRIFD